MIVIVQHPVPDPEFLEDRHLLDREVHTVVVPEVLIVGMIVLQLALVRRTGDVDRPLHLLGIQTIPLVGLLETHPSDLRRQYTQNGCTLPDLDHPLHETTLLQDLPTEIRILPDQLLETVLESALPPGLSFQDHLHVDQLASDHRRRDQAAAVISQHPQALQLPLRLPSRFLRTVDKTIQAQ
jgi:hypothetical protein